ncbi:Nitronate monooxygenase [Thermus thermophilus]|uniref:Nitronate monooxygenase n=1 Tax=Thermus thermophilus TaxID=274 RepID=A0A3P4ATJ8_THETH|nr:nitronate monooxygenase [Thermus thermophilus]VCU53754.1 Nitronate monooxygenase [Thermus thermophilus]
METAITRMLGLRYPIVAAPMFLVSNGPLLQAVAEAGGIGVIPSLNFRTHEAFREFLESFPRVPFGVNLILKDNPRLEEDLKAVVERRVPLVVTSLGDPTRVVERVKAYGGVVWCDVVGLRHGRKAVEAGADALVAVAAGAGGHAGMVSPFVLGPWLREELGVPVLIAGGIATGRQVLAALALGDGVYIGTRFIATRESAAPLEYKEALLRATPEDILYTPEVTGVPANFLRDSLERFRKGGGKAWKEVYSAGHGVAFIREIPSAKEVVARLVEEYRAAKAGLP